MAIKRIFYDVILLTLLCYSDGDARSIVSDTTQGYGEVVFREKVTWYNLDKPTEAFLVIHKHDNAAEVTEEFYNKYAINADALFSLLDRVCVGENLCQPTDKIFFETVSIENTAERTGSIGIDIVVRVQDDPSEVVRKLVSNSPFLKPMRHRLLNRVCSRIGLQCKRYNVNVGEAFDNVKTILRTNYMKTESNFRKEMNMLEIEAKTKSSYIEGNLWSDKSQAEESQSQSKRECEIFAISMLAMFHNPKSLLEIGFNAGHSLSIFLRNIPSIDRVYEFDICQHEYVLHNFEVVKTMFPNVNITLECGDSKETLFSTFQSIVPKVDVIHIDGGHDYNVCSPFPF